MPTFWDKLAVMCNESNILTNSRNVVSNTSPNSYIIHLTAFLVTVVHHLYCFLSDHIFIKSPCI